ncbi:MAG TPA: adenine phosphoribosyltransferase, partial [Thermoanaerobaculia bacterium]
MSSSEAARGIDLAPFIRDVPDFPKPGIIFKDITPLLRSREALAAAIDMMAAPFRAARVTQVAAIESRGFIFGGAIATA